MKVKSKKVNKIKCKTFKKIEIMKIFETKKTKKTEKAEKTERTGKTRIYNLIILDKSGSMSSIANAAIGGFNETVESIKAAQKRFADTQEHYVSLMVFCDCEKKLVYDKVPVEKVKTLTSRNYQPCCSTPLYDAMGMSLTRLRKDIMGMDDATAVVTVITDGYENASREFSGRAIKALVEDLSDNEGWNFAYMGANQDVEKVSLSLSIHNTISFEYDEAGTSDAFRRDRDAKQRMYERMNDSHCCEMNMAPEERKRFRANENRRVSYFEEEEDTNQNRITPDKVTRLAGNEIFVFGSNVQGQHNGGAAGFALSHFGAEWGKAEGLAGQTYAIPTVGCDFDVTRSCVDKFIAFAIRHPEFRFLVTPIGCGNAGLTEEQVAPLFAIAQNVPNICLPAGFWRIINMK